MSDKRNVIHRFLNNNERRTIKAKIVAVCPEGKDIHL
jgi:hypothetical protein